MLWLSHHVMHCAVSWCCRKELTRCWHHALGLPSLQNHELNKLLFLINYQSVIVCNNNREYSKTENWYREVLLVTNIQKHGSSFGMGYWVALPNGLEESGGAGWKKPVLP